MRVLVYQNPAAGHTPRHPEALITELQRAGHEVEWMDSSANSIPDDAAERYELVVAAGGDGNVGRAGRQLVGRGIPLAICPLGTANNLSRTLRSTRDDLVERIDAWRIEPFDVGTLEGMDDHGRFLEGFGIGAFPHAAAGLTDQGSLSAPFGQDDELARDLVGLRRVLRGFEPVPVELEVDGDRIDGRYLMVEVLNIGTVGPRVLLAPKADPGDGWLDLVLLSESNRRAMLEYLDDMTSGMPPVEIRRGRQVVLRADDGLTAHVDGKSAVLRGPVAAALVSGGLRVLTGPPDLDDSVPAAAPTRGR